MGVVSRGVGQYVASEVHRALWARKTAPGAQLVVYVQGSHAVADGAYASERADLEALAEAGFIVALGDVSQTTTQGTFGNETVQTRIGQIRALMQGTNAPLQAAAGKMHLVAGSGGAAGALNYARANPANVASIVGLLPLVDLQDVYENRTDATVTKAEMDAAYQPGGVAASYATHNPSAAGNQAALAGIPMKLYYSTNDPYIPVERITNYQTLVRAAGGTCEVESIGAAGHTDAGVDYDAVAAFLRAYS